MRSSNSIALFQCLAACLASNGVRQRPRRMPEHAERKLAASKAADLGILWALGAQQCPPCPDCVVTCPAVTCSTPSINITCPTFACPTIPSVSGGTSSWTSFLGFLAGLVVGFGVLTCAGLVSRCSSFLFRTSSSTAEPSDADTRDLALKQLAIIRQRHGVSR